MMSLLDRGGLHANSASELNQDQMRAVALVAKPMQEAWEQRRFTTDNDSKQLPMVGCIVRLLIVGGGGCGKARIFNKVLIPLLETF